MADTVANITNHSDWLPAIYVAEAMLQLQNHLVITPRMDMSLSPQLATRGQKVIIPKTGTLTLTRMVDGTSLELTAPSGPGTVELILSEQVIVPFGTQQALAQMGSVDARQAYMREAIMMIAQDIETFNAGLYSSLTGTYGSIAVDLDTDALPEIIKVLKDAKCPAGYFDMEDGVNLFIATKDGMSFRQDTVFTDAAGRGDAGPGPRITGRLGRYMGVNIFESQSIKTSGGAYHNMCFAKGALGFVSAPMAGPGQGGVIRSEFISMPLGNEGEGSIPGIVFRVDECWDWRTQSTVITVACLYGAGVKRAALGVNVTS